MPLPEASSPAAPPPTWRIDLNLLDQNPFQPRREIDEPALGELVDSIRNHGLLQPVTVRRIPGGRFQLIAGHRRLEAFRRLRAEAGAEHFGAIPAHEKYDVSDEEMALFALVENLQRDDLSPLDAAIGLARFQDAQQLSTEALAQRTGLELDRVKRLLRLARTPRVIQDACHQGVLVQHVDERGQPKLLASGNPRHERVRLDLMAALEFAKLHAHATKAAPKMADERTSKAIERALSERWSFRRIQAFCRSAIVGTEIAAERAAPAPLFIDGAELRIRRGRVHYAPPQERAALLELLILLVAELGREVAS